MEIRHLILYQAFDILIQHISPEKEEIQNLAAAKLLQLCPTLCNPIGGSPPGSPVPGYLQAGTLEWVAISFSSAWKWEVKGKTFSRVRLLATPWTAAHQAPPSVGFSRREYWSGCHCLLHQNLEHWFKILYWNHLRKKRLLLCLISIYFHLIHMRWGLGIGIFISSLSDSHTRESFRITNLKKEGELK